MAAIATPAEGAQRRPATSSGGGQPAPEDVSFQLSEDEMKKIQYLGRLERKSQQRMRGRRGVEQKRNRFSEQLSIEAQIAMQLALKDTQAMKRQGDDRAVDRNRNVTFADEKANGDDGAKRTGKGKDGEEGVDVAGMGKGEGEDKVKGHPSRPSTRCSRASSFAEVFEMRGSQRMPFDLTDTKYASPSPSSAATLMAAEAAAMAGGKRSLDGTKVGNALEIVEIVNHEHPINLVDDDVIEKIARRNAVEKCLVWMEVGGGADGRSNPLSPEVTPRTPRSGRQPTAGDSATVTRSGSRKTGRM